MRVPPGRKRTAQSDIHQSFRGGQFLNFHLPRLRPEAKHADLYLELSSGRKRGGDLNAVHRCPRRGDLTQIGGIKMEGERRCHRCPQANGASVVAGKHIPGWPNQQTDAILQPSNFSNCIGWSSRLDAVKKCRKRIKSDVLSAVSR